MRIGVIGYRNHALRLLKLMDGFDFEKRFVIYYPKLGTLEAEFSRDEIKSKYLLSSEFKDICETDVIVVASPTDTHYEYLDQLSEVYEGYIFCEKPPCGTASELNRLSQLSHELKTRIFFNFCYRYSAFAVACKTIVNSGDYGIPVALSFRSGHGLAFKEGYKSNWRNISQNPMNNIIGNVGIHYIDLTDHILGDSTALNCSTARVSGATRYQDSVHISIERNNGLPSTVFLSYACPLDDFSQLILSDGIVELHKNSLTIQGPRDCFDLDGLFKAPPVKRQISFVNSRAYYDDAIVNAFKEFFSGVRASEPFPVSQFESAIVSTEKVLSLQRGLVGN